MMVLLRLSVYIELLSSRRMTSDRATIACSGLKLGIPALQSLSGHHKKYPTFKICMRKWRVSHFPQSCGYATFDKSVLDENSTLDPRKKTDFYYRKSDTSDRQGLPSSLDCVKFGLTLTAQYLILLVRWPSYYQQKKGSQTVRIFDFTLLGHNKHVRVLYVLS